MKCVAQARLCLSSWPGSNASSWCFSLDHLKVSAVFMPVRRTEAVCTVCVGVVPICCSTHANRALINHGAIGLDIYLFMEGLPTFTMDGPTVIKTWASCCSEGWFLPVSARRGFYHMFCLLKHLMCSRFWKVEEKLVIYTFLISALLWHRLWQWGCTQSAHTGDFHWEHLINRGMVSICCIFSCCFSGFICHIWQLAVGYKCKIYLLRSWGKWRDLGWNRCPL